MTAHPLTHPDPDLNYWLGAWVASGGDLAEHPIGIWAYCGCEDEDHAVLVRREFVGRDYKATKINAMQNVPCMKLRTDVQ